MDFGNKMCALVFLPYQLVDMEYYFRKVIFLFYVRLFLKNPLLQSIYIQEDSFQAQKHLENRGHSFPFHSHPLKIHGNLERQDNPWDSLIQSKAKQRQEL